MKSILVCTNHRASPNQPSCGARGASALKDQIAQAVNETGLEIGVKEIQCLGECETGPNLRLIPGGPMFRHVNEGNIKDILKTAKDFLKR